MNKNKQFYTTTKDYFKHKDIKEADFNHNFKSKNQAQSPTPQHEFNNIRTNSKCGTKFNMYDKEQSRISKNFASAKNLDHLIANYCTDGLPEIETKVKKD